MKAVESSMGFSLSDLGMINVLRAFTGAFAGPVWARLADTGDRKVLMASACLGWGLISCLFAGAFHQTTFVTLIVLDGIMLASMGPIAQSVVPDIAPAGQVGRAFGLMASIGSAGSIIAMMFVTPISQMTILGMNGWRLAFLIFGGLSVANAVAIYQLFKEPRTAAQILKNSESSSIGTYLDIVKNKTWMLVCLQGIFGSIPYSALAFLTMWLQYLGFADFSAAAIASCQIIGHVLGSLVSGCVGDWAATKSQDHGRIWTAVIADSLRSPVLIMTFVLAPKFGTNMVPYAACVFLIGFLMPWPSVACGKVIFTEIVPQTARASIVAAQGIVEKCFGSLGGIAVGFVAQGWYAYDTNVSKQAIAEMSDQDRMNNAHALGKAMLVTTVTPWMLCTILYAFVHFTYKHDRDRARAMEPETSSTA
eukprot:gnl/MRDRNA2_/MRDRNA2_157203_c0_seq1.p1 gnl/MRDRNA2_/MRDRNA2_157203_c0~~gnl/MRDRNA2_/MRDRNA2_157203_c0_seq1.p1  ORF type:complete len:429 (+),score=62.31 gnl/MRDRNA2_/MRDRNA2_157203_c0_seq1:25-1287(+)